MPRHNKYGHRKQRHKSWNRKHSRRKDNARRIISVRRTKSGFWIERMGWVDVPVTKTRVRMAKADGTPLKRPVKEAYEEMERRSGMEVIEVKRRKSARRLGVAI